jgi:hypothetical protein
MMFQTRSFTFNLTNPALTALSYQWHILDKEGNPDTSGAWAAEHSRPRQQPCTWRCTAWLDAGAHTLVRAALCCARVCRGVQHQP